ncbi:hypothetical protein J6590_092089 [Homalodisca vitripennis]|nr:hypothetical protein J6590_092089 [Homalodisca vitripennis]
MKDSCRLSDSDEDVRRVQRPCINSPKQTQSCAAHGLEYQELNYPRQVYVSVTAGTGYRDKTLTQHNLYVLQDMLLTLRCN